MTMSSIPFILIVIKTLVGTATSACSNPIGKQTMSCFYSYTLVMMFSGIKDRKLEKTEAKMCCYTIREQ